MKSSYATNLTTINFKCCHAMKFLRKLSGPYVNTKYYKADYQSKINLPATQSCILSASSTLHSSVHLVKAVGILERVPSETERASMLGIQASTKPTDCYLNNNSLNLTCLSPGTALLMEKVIQQLVIRTSNDVHIFISDQKARTTTRLQRQRARQL